MSRAHPCGRSAEARHREAWRRSSTRARLKMDDFERIPELIGLAREVDLGETVKWLQQAWSRARVGNNAIQESSPAQEVRAAPGRGQDLQRDVRGVESRDGRREASRTRQAKGQAEGETEAQAQAEMSWRA